MILVIIQARMSSSRLPGKVMKKIIGRPMIFYLLQRLKSSQKINQIVVATSKKRADDPLAKYIKSQKVDVFRGSEDDVLARFYQAAKEYKAEHIVRITADCPLLDPKILDKLIAFYFQTKADYARLSEFFAEGLDCEVISFKALKTAFKKAKLASEREHVSLYLHNHAKDFKRVKLANKIDDGKYRITVDEPEDFEVVAAIFKALYKKSSPLFGFDQIKKFLDQHPQIMAKNMEIMRNEGLLKSLNKDKQIQRRQPYKKTVLLRVDASEEIGLGHLMRMVALAQAFKRRKIESIFVMRDYGVKFKKIVQSQLYKVELIPANLSFSKDANLTLSLAEKYRANLVVTDLSHQRVLTNLKGYQKYIETLKKSAKFLVAVDGLGPDSVAQKVKLPFDIIIVPYFGANKASYKIGPKTKLLLGPKYFILREKFVKQIKKGPKRKIKKIAKNILLDKNLNKLTLPGLNYKTAVNLDDKALIKLILWADLAVLSSGLTRYEAAALGLPCLILARNKAHDQIMRQYLKSGTCLYLGKENKVKKKEVVKKIKEVLGDNNLREKMSLRAKKLIDGRGGERVVRGICRLLNIS